MLFDARRLFAIIPAVLFLAGSAVAQAPVQPRYEVAVTYDLVYGTGLVTSPEGVPGTKELTLDVYRPEGADAPGKPGVVLIHGGAFTGGSPRDLATMANYLAERGFVCFSIAYRLQGDKPPAMPDAAFADAKAAVRWVRAHAGEYGIDPGRIGAFGHSAGAFSVAVLATTDPEDFQPDGPTIAPFNTPDESPRIQAAVLFAGGTRYMDELDPSDTPMLMVHGANDPILPIEGAKALRDACAQKGIECTMLEVPGGGHDPWFDVVDGKPVLQWIADYLYERLTGPAEAAAPERDVRYTLDTSKTEHGTVRLDPPGGTYSAGTVVACTPVPNKHYRFAYWAGDVRETGETVHVTMGGNRRIEAGFVPEPDAPRRAVETAADGPGRVVAAPQGRQTFVEGDEVVLAASPEPGARFKGWSGDASGGENPLRLTVDGPKKVRAEFEAVLGVAPLADQPSSGVEGRLTVETAAKDPRVAPLWPRPWFTLGADGAMTFAPNVTPYSRTALLRIVAGEAGVVPLDVPVTQAGVPGTAPAATGTGVAVYTGLPGETGLIRWWEQSPVDLRHRVLESNGDGSFTVGAFGRGAVGVLTVDGTTPLALPNGDEDYHAYVSWLLPADPQALPDPRNSERRVAPYFQFGIDSDAVNRQNIRFGVEWKDIGNGPEWVIGGQRFTDEVSAAKVNGGAAPRHVRLHVWKDQDGDTVFRPGTAAVKVEYSLDFGPWQEMTFPKNWNPAAFPIEAVGFDNGDDYLTFRAAGLSSECLYDVRVEGAAVPAVNANLDSDGDGEPNGKDPYPANGEYTSASDSTDKDANGLPDAWETAKFGAAGQDPWADPDADGRCTLREFLSGNDPLK